jgi:predicted glycoside hydrolase/deacetylase ChbG (UPF0249 family)
VRPKKEEPTVVKPLLIIQADDAGVHPAIDRGILSAIDRGPVTSVGVIVSGATAADFAEELEKRTEVGVALHLTLTGAPALASTRLALQGEALPPSWASLGRRLARGAISRDDVLTELRAQIRRARTLGLAIDHVDGHEHVHLMPGIADAIARLVRDEGLPPRVRISRTPRGELVRDPRAVALRAASSFSRRTAWRNVASPDRVVGIADTGSVRNLLRVLATVGPGARAIELIVHPGDRAMPGEPPLPNPGLDYVAELDALVSTAWRDVLAHEYVLGTYRDLSPHY